MENQTQDLHIDNWVIRVRAPEGPGPHPVALLLHGLSGDEKVMWVFAPRLPQDYLLLSPRGLYPFSEGGFSWYPDHQNSNPAIKDFQKAVTELLILLDTLQNKAKEGKSDTQKQPWQAIRQADFSRINLVGFSQGAALSYAFAMFHQERVELLAGLAGFMPEGAEALAAKQPLVGKNVFVTHGTKDETVPVERARQSVEVLRKAGAEVSYCEEETGHKLSLVCFRSLGAFFSENKTPQSSAR